MTKNTYLHISSTLGVFIVLVSICLLLISCDCKHKWAEAGCTTAKTCTLCGETEGKPIGHTWDTEDCEKIRTCSVCKLAENPLGHTWTKATCLVKKTCSVCKKTEGELADHVWIAATTEAPKTCNVCQKTEGTRIITDPRFVTASCKDIFGTWTGRVQLSGEAFDLPDFSEKMDLTYTVVFWNDGTYKMTFVQNKKAAFMEALEEYHAQTVYDLYAELGLSKEDADKEMIDQFGMDVKAYASMLVNADDLTAKFAPNIPNGVYYIANGVLYRGESWKDTLKAENFTLSDSTLKLSSLTDRFADLILKRTIV